MKRLRPVRDERGQAATFSIVVVAVVVLLAALLVYRVAWTAASINKKASTIQRTAVPINRATDAVTNIPETNRLATSILTSAKPLESQLAEVIRLAQDVDRLAASINNTAGTIDTTASAIDVQAAGILPVARAILTDVNIINRNLDGTIARARAIDSDTSDILGLAALAHRQAACIDRELGGIPLVGGGTGADGHC